MLPSIWIVVVLLVGSIFPLSLADTDLGDPCSSADDCSLYAELGYTFTAYCHPQQKTCYTAEGDSTGGEDTGQGGLDEFVEDPFAEDIFDQTETDLLASGQVAAAVPISSALEQQVESLSSGVAVAEGRITAAEQSIAAIQTNIQDLSSKLSQLGSALNEFQAQQSQQQEELQSDVKTVATGLAGLQDNVAETQEQVTSLEQDVAERISTSQMIWLIVLTVVVIGGIAGGVYYFRGGFGQQRLHPNIHSFITSHLRSGKKFPQIKESLAKAGWNHDDAAWAYRETLRKNYQQYRAAQPVTSAKISGSPNVGGGSRSKEGNGSNPNKTMITAAVSIILLIGMFFLLKGVTGQAIHFTAEQELDAFVKDLLVRLTDESDFYSLMPASTLCVEVFDQSMMVAYTVTLNAGKHEVVQVPSCSATAQYDFSVRFADWQTFSTVMRKASCDVFAHAHGKGLWVLPSKYILPGFKKNPFEDASKFCPVLVKCLDKEQILKMKVTC